MKTKHLLLLAVAAVLLPKLGFSTATTHIWAPSTDVQAYRVWHITSDMYLPVEGDTNGVRTPAVTNIGLTVGVLPYEKVNMEVGFDHKSGYGLFDRYPLYFNAKFGVPEGALVDHSPAFAVGIYDIGTKSYDKDTHVGTDYNIVYGELAGTIDPLGRLSLGYFSGKKELLVDERGEADNTGVLVAWERTMTELSDKLWLCVEYMGSQSAYGTLNFGASWKFADNVSLLAGYDAFNNADLNLPNTFTVQVDIDFDCPFRGK
jgi:hypothetical protein